jgi:peroxiredoxin
MSAVLLGLLLSLPSAPLPTVGATPQSLDQLVRAQKLTAVFFWSWPCPVVRSHAKRFQALVQDFSSRGVTFIAVDSQADATVEHAEKARAERGDTFPLVLDLTSSWADALDVRFSATLVILDQQGRVRYRGGLDSNRVKLTDDAVPLAREALERLLAGQEPAQTQTKALGCVLRRQ